ncbi:MAG: hypothetical protein WC244_02050 [Patescibacteria group bacterium]
MSQTAWWKRPEYNYPLPPVRPYKLGQKCLSRQGKKLTVVNWGIPYHQENAWHFAIHLQDPESKRDFWDDGTRYTYLTEETDDTENPPQDH